MPKSGQETDVIERIKKKTTYVGDCWIYTGKLVGRGYGEVWYRGKSFRLNRLIAHLYHGMHLYDTEHTANHKAECTSKACWNPDHIYVGNQKENVKDQITSGNFHYGTENVNGGKNFNKENWMKSRKEGIE